MTSTSVCVRPKWTRILTSENKPLGDRSAEVLVWDLDGSRTVGLRRHMPATATAWARLTMTAPDEAVSEDLEAILGREGLVQKPLKMDPTREEQEDDCFCLFPIRYDTLYQMYQLSKASFWTPEEIDFTQDLKDFEALSSRERRYIELVLAFFASADNLVMKNLGANFLNEIRIAEVHLFYSFQDGIEAIHAETYNLAIDTLVTKNVAAKRELFQALRNIPSIRAKGLWVKYWIGNSQLPFAQRLLAFACVEGIFFSSSFCALFWLRKRGIMPGLTLSNEFISRDEGLHTLFACELYKEMGRPLSQTFVHALVAEAVFMEDAFVAEALPQALLGMNCEAMQSYVRFVADWLLTQLGCDKLFFEENPFPFMEMISLGGKTNFFEKKVSDYAKVNRALHGEVDRAELRFDDDF